MYFQDGFPKHLSMLACPPPFIRFFINSILKTVLWFGGGFFPEFFGE